MPVFKQSYLKSQTVNTSKGSRWKNKGKKIIKEESTVSEESWSKTSLRDKLFCMCCCSIRRNGRPTEH